MMKPCLAILLITIPANAQPPTRPPANWTEANALKIQAAEDDNHIFWAPDWGEAAVPETSSPVTTRPASSRVYSIARTAPPPTAATPRINSAPALRERSYTPVAESNLSGGWGGGSSYRASGSGGPVHVKGHMRRTPSGGMTYVRPHTRSRPRR